MASLLRPYQQRAIKGFSEKKFSIWLSSRQIGKSTAVSVWSLLRALEIHNHKVICLSSSAAQSKELMEKIKINCEAMKRIGSEIHESFFEDTKITQLEIVFNNKSRIIGLPANARTARGYSGDVVLDEFAFHEDNKKIWQAMYPSITAGDYHVVTTSTAQGKNDWFYHLWNSSERKSNWYRILTTIYDAVNDGLHIYPEELREGIEDDDLWATEYLCQFMDSSDVLLSYELIESCEIDDCLVNDLNELMYAFLLFGGDIGRRKDLSVFTIIQKLGDIHYLRMQEILRNIGFNEQFKVADHLLSYCRRGKIDETGIGMQLSEDLHRKWGDRITPVTFTPSTKERIANGLKNLFTDKLIRIPKNRELREDFHSVRKLVSTNGNISYAAPHTSAGHGDRFWSTALSCDAGRDIKTECTNTALVSRCQNLVKQSILSQIGN